MLLKPPEIAYYLGDSDAQAVITSAATISEAAKGAASARVQKIFVVTDGQRAADTLPAEFLDSFERKFGVIILELYGLTESGPVAPLNRRDDRKSYRVGKPIWGVDMQVWDVVRVPARHYQPIQLSLRGPEPQ